MIKAAPDRTDAVSSSLDHHFSYRRSYRAHARESSQAATLPMEAKTHWGVPIRIVCSQITGFLDFGESRGIRGVVAGAV